MAGLEMLPLGTAHCCLAWQRQQEQAEGAVTLSPASLIKSRVQKESKAGEASPGEMPHSVTGGCR